MNRLTCFVIWEFTSKGGRLSPSRKSTPVSLPSSLMALILRVPWNHLDDLLNTHIHTHTAGLHPRSFWLFHETQECFLLVSSHICWCYWSGRVTPEAPVSPHDLHSALQVLRLAPTSRSCLLLCPLILAPRARVHPLRREALPEHPRKCCFPLPSPSMSHSLVSFPLRLLSLSEITFVWLSQG